MRIVCPKDNSHKRFITRIEESELWIVGEDGTYIDTAADSSKIKYEPSPPKHFVCEQCGTTANVVEE